MAKDKEKFPYEFDEYGPNHEWKFHLDNLEDTKLDICSREGSVHYLMEYYCYLVKKNKLIPRGLQVFIAKAFWNHLVNKKSLNSSFGYTKTKSGPNKKFWGLYNEFLYDVLYIIITKGVSKHRARELSKESMNRKGKTIGLSTLADYMNEKKFPGLIKQTIYFVIDDIELEFYKPLSQKMQDNMKKHLNFDYSPINSQEHLNSLKNQERVMKTKKEFGLDTEEDQQDFF